MKVNKVHYCVLASHIMMHPVPVYVDIKSLLEVNIDAFSLTWVTWGTGACGQSENCNNKNKQTLQNHCPNHSHRTWKDCPGKKEKTPVFKS